MIKLSVVIPSYKDPYLMKTIQSLLDNSELGDALEIIAVFDGYWPAWDMIQDPRVRYVHLGANRGMREAINAGVNVSRGEFFMRLDEHCSFGKGYDRILTEACQPNEIMTARRFFLDPVKWEVMDLEPIDYEKLVIQDMGNGVRKFSGQRWKSRTEQRKDIMVDENMAMQGSMWIMPRKWWDTVIGGKLSSEGYGPMYQDSVEVMMKTWQAGGRFMLNKNTWFAHKHRSFSRTHQEGTKENPSKREDSWKHALDVWEEYYINELRPRFEV